MSATEKPICNMSEALFCCVFQIVDEKAGGEWGGKKSIDKKKEEKVSKEPKKKKKYQRYLESKFKGNNKKRRKKKRSEWRNFVKRKSGWGMGKKNIDKKKRKRFQQ